MRYPPRFPPIDDIPDSSENILDTDIPAKEIQELISSVLYAVRKDTLLSKDNPEVASFLEGLLSQFYSTHNTIQLLVNHAYKEENWIVIADMASLLREQIEKIFMVVVILDNPRKWTIQHIRSAWLQDFEDFMLQREEYGKIPRFKQFLTSYLPANLKKLRRLPPQRRGNKGSLIVSTYAERFAHFRWHFPGRFPRWRFIKTSFKFSNYFFFPKPSEALRMTSHNVNYRLFLERWHREYSHYSDYTHVGIQKLVLQHLGQGRGISAAEKQRTYAERRAELIVFTSYSVGATLCALIIPRLSNDFGAKAQARKFWEFLREFFLLPRALWNIYAKDLLP